MPVLIVKLLVLALAENETVPELKNTTLGRVLEPTRYPLKEPPEPLKYKEVAELVAIVPPLLA